MELEIPYVKELSKEQCEEAFNQLKKRTEGDGKHDGKRSKRSDDSRITMTNKLFLEATQDTC